MKNLLNNTGAMNNMEGRVVAIKATAPTVKRIDPLAGLDKDIHARLCKTLMSSLYDLVPIYRMITISGYRNNEGQLAARICDVTGGNSPVVRKFLYDNQEIRTVNIVMLDSNGNPTGTRTITTGVKSNGVEYVYCDSLALIKFDMDESTTEARQIAMTIYDKVIAEGISIDKDGNIFIGKVEDAEKIDALIATPSNERNKQMLATNEDADIAWSKLEEAGGHAISRKLESGMSLAKFKKLAKRIGIFATPAIPFARVGNDEFGVCLVDTEVLGTFDYNKEVNDILSSMGINIDNNQYDGICWFSNNFMLKGINNLGVKHLNARQAGMFAPQNRTEGLYSKCLADVVSKRIIDRIVAVLTNKLGEAVKIIGNSNEIGLIVDTNGAKLLDLDYDFGKDGVMVYLLDLAKGTKSATDNQLSYKLMTMDAEATVKAYEELSYRDMCEFNNSYADVANGLLDKDLNSTKLLVNLAKNNPGTALASQVFTDKYIMSDIAKEAVKKHEAAYRKGKVSVDSIFQRAMFECSYIITGGKIEYVLGVDSRGAIECYSKDILEDKKDRIAEIEEDTSLTAYQKKILLDEELTTFGVKHPAPGMEEIQPFRMVTDNEIKARLANLFRLGKINEEDMDLLFQYFYFTSYGVIKMAPSNTVKHKLAGMDTDFDGIKVITEKSLVAIVMNFYAKKKEDIENAIGRIDLAYGGVIPYIDCDKKAINYLEEEVVKEQIKDTVQTQGTWADAFNLA